MTPPPPATKVFGVHTNFRSRAAQRGRVPAVPSYFLKPPSSLAPSGSTIVRPRGAELLAFEGEIAIVIGTRARGITPEDGAAHIGWVAPANDFGLYDMRWADRGSNVLAKGQDGYTPMGEPVAVDGLDLAALTLRTRVNGEVVQEDTTDDLLFPFGLLVADLARFITLEPGDVILTGTPAGSRPVEPGDVVEVELEGAGSVTTTVVESGDDLPDFGAKPKSTPAVVAAAWGRDEPRPVTLSAEARAALLRVSTATLTTQLRRHGIANTFMTGLRPTRPEQRLLGYAFTLRYVPLREDLRDAETGLNAQKRAIESIGPEDVLVIDARRDPGAGTIGDILAARALARGATGIVTDGGMRDRGTIAELEIPTYYQAPHAAVLGLIHHPQDINVTIACGGTTVVPGDVIVGDSEGVLVIPAALAEQVAHDSLDQEEREEWALERVQAGDSIDGIFPLGEERRAEFEAWRAAREDEGAR